MDFIVDEQRKQMLDDEFDAFSMLARGNYVSVYDIRGKLTRYSPGAVELFGLPGEYIPDGAYDWVEYVHPEDRKRYLGVMSKLISGATRSYDLTYRVRTAKSGYATFRYIGAVIRATDGRPSLVGGMMVNQGMLDDIDPITVLRNKVGFFDDLPGLMKNEERVVTLLLGTSGLTSINEIRGYSFGNRVLQSVSWLIQENAAGRGTVYRMDDATFAFVTTQLSEPEVAALYDSIRVKLQRGVRIDGIRNSLTCNGGMIATRGLLMDVGAVYSCLTYAYRVSRFEKHGELVDFNGTTGYSARDSLRLINRVRDCVLDECRGFSLLYQLVIDPRTERPLGVEALLRWSDPEYGTVLPADFLPVLEKDFVYEELTSWILRRAMTDGRRLLERDPRFTLGFNLSLSQLEDEYFTDELFQDIAETGFPAENLCLEFTRGVRLMPLRQLADIVSALHARGVRVIIDDFGSGLDSVPFVKALAADYVKLDIDFMRRIEDSEADRRTLKHMIGIAAANNATVCVKGVETAATRDILRQYPIECVQGNFYSEPVDIDRVLEMLDAPR